MTGLVNRAVQWAANAVARRAKPGSAGRAEAVAAPEGRVFRISPQLDATRQMVARQLNAAKLRRLLDAADAGDLASGLGLFEEMEEKDSRLASVTATRRLSLTGLEWEITPEDADDAEAQKIADYCTETLVALDHFEEALEHLATAIGPNLAVVELVWEGRELIDVVPILSHRLTMHPLDPGVVRVITEENRMGVPAVGAKWVVHAPHGGLLFPFARSLTRKQAFLHVVKMIAIVDWGTFCSIYGMPSRWAKYPKGTDPEQRADLMAMMANFGANAYGVFQEGVELEIKESSSRGTSPHEAFVQFVCREQSILMLGGNLTSDTTGGTGTYAAGSVQDEVKDDIRKDDIRREARTIRRQILTPMVRMIFGPDAPVPYWGRIEPETVDRRAEGEVIAAAQRAGLRIPSAWAYERMEIPMPEEGEDVLVPSLDAFGAALEEGERREAGGESEEEGREARG